MENCFITLRHISKSLDKQNILSDVNLSLYSGKFHGLIGYNGAGKSVLVKLLSGVYAPDNGEFAFLGKPCHLSSPLEALHHGIITIYQQCNLIPNLTVAENLCIGHWLYKGKFLKRVDWKSIWFQAEHFLQELNCPISPDLPVSQLNPGQQRLVEIVKALIQKPYVLVIDDSYCNLAPPEIQNIINILQKLCQKGTSVLYISQRIEELLSLCDDITILQEGKTTTYKTSHENAKKEELMQKLSLQGLKRKFPRIHSHDARIVLEARNLSTARGLKNVSLQLHKGEVLGIAGRLGSGRTALARALFGIDPLTAGQITINGTTVKFRTPSDAVKARIGYISDSEYEECLFHNFSIAENITIASLKDISSFKHLNLVYERFIAEQFQKKLFIHTCDGSPKIHSLSNGNRQKVLFSKWIFTNSRIFIMEEPAKGIDKSGKIEIYNIINKLVMDGKSVILISSDFYELMGMSDRILVMDNGRITSEVSRNEFSIPLLTQKISSGIL